MAKTFSLMIKFLTVGFGISLTLGASAQTKNIKLAELEGSPPWMGISIAINHKDLNNLVASVGIDRATYSMDRGNSWSESKLGGAFGDYGGTALIADSKGNFHCFHLADPNGKGPSADTWLDRIVCQTSEDGGKTWSPGTSIGNNPPNDQVKPRPSAHPHKGLLYLTWTQFNHYGVKDPACQSNILFSMSTNDGKKWSEPFQLNHTPGDCVDDDNTPNGGVPAAAVDGKLFVAWSNQGVIFFDRSYDGGETWLNNDLAIGHQPGGWSMSVPGIERCNSMPALVVDESNSYYRSSLYLVWADQSNGENDTDIWFARSTNRGDTWTQPKRVNQDGIGKHQFLPSMVVDPATGVIYIVYYDRRAYEDLQTDVYVAYSADGGIKFTEMKISEQTFVPAPDAHVGGCLGIAAFKGIIALVWTRIDGQNASAWTAVLKQEDFIKKEELPKMQVRRR